MATGTVVLQMSDPTGAYPPYPPAPPPPSGWQPPPAWQQPPPPDAPTHTAAVVIAIVGAAALFVVGIGVAGWATFNRDDGPSHPDDWDPRVADIAQFVQTQRGVLFEHPVYVDFLPDEEFSSEVTTSEDDLTDEDRESLEDAEAALRALGLVDGDVDLFEDQNQLTGEGAAAFYDPETERITVRGTELTPDLRGTIAHEMTHALQDQYVDLEAVEAELDEDEVSLYRAVVEGDAVRVEDAYVASEFSQSEREEYVDRSQAAAADVDLEGVPPALVAFFQAPYVFGPSFVSVIEAEEGNSGLNQALRAPPTSDRQLLDPRLYLDRSDPEPVDPPELPEGADVVEDGEFGALSWYVVLASRLDPKTALSVIDDWAGDSYATYDDDGRVCVEARYRATDGAGAGRVEILFEEWVQTMGGDSASVSAVDERTIELVSCDPGPGVAPAGTSSPELLLAVPAARLAIAADLTEDAGAPLDDAWCVGETVVDALTIGELTSAEVSAETQQKLFGAMATCGLRPG